MVLKESKQKATSSTKILLNGALAQRKTLQLMSKKAGSPGGAPQQEAPGVKRKLSEGKSQNRKEGDQTIELMVRPGNYMRNIS